jgi:hypothetical protein
MKPISSLMVAVSLSLLAQYAVSAEPSGHHQLSAADSSLILADNDDRGSSGERRGDHRDDVGDGNRGDHDDGASGKGGHDAGDRGGDHDGDHDGDRDGDDHHGNSHRCARDDDDKNAGVVHLDMPYPGIQTSVWPDGSVALAIPIENTGSVGAGDVEVTGIQLPAVQFIAPATFPVVVGEILPIAMQTRTVDARVKVASYGTTIPVQVRGTYRKGHRRCDFTLTGSIAPQPRTPGTVTATQGSLAKLTVGTVQFPPPPPAQPPSVDFNDFNFVPTPQGPPRNLMTTAPSGTQVMRIAPLLQQASAQAAVADPPANAFVITRNTTTTANGGFPPDPSVAGANASQIVMMSYNTAVSLSTNGGAGFTSIGLTPGSFSDPSNPGRNAMFPEDDGGLCCDQVMTYIPSQNIFVWLLQYWPLPNQSGPNRLRIAWASPQAIASNFLYAWTWVDLTSAALGIGIEGLDYPDLAFSSGWLYVGVDHVINVANGTQNGKVYSNRHIFARLSLADMVNPSSSVVNYWWMDPTYNGLIQNHIAQGSGDAMIFGALPDTSTVTLFNWPDASGSASYHDISVSSYNPSGSSSSSLAPDGVNWNVAPLNILGAVRVYPFCLPSACDYVYFAYSVNNNGSGRPYPYVRVEKIDPGTNSLVDETDIFNSGFAFSTPAFSTLLGSGRDEVAMSLAVGGGGGYANNAVGFLGDFVVYVTTNSDTTQAVYNKNNAGQIIRDSNGNPTFYSRWGDYFSVRDSAGPPTANGTGIGYSTAAYDVTSAVSGSACYQVGCNAPMHYIQFGHYGDLFPAPPPPLQ